MHKIFIVAHSEFSMLVRTRAFVVTLILMPVLMAASIGLSRAARNATDTNTRTFAYIDRSGVIAPALEAAAAARNATANASGQPRYEPVAVDPSGKSEDELRLELSDRVRSKEIYAFVEIPAGVMNPDQPDEVRYYSNSPSYQALPQWLRTTIGAVVVSQRFRAAAVDPSVVERLIRPTAVNALGLL